MAFFLVVLRTQWEFFQGGTEGNWTLETQGEASISTPINHATPQSPLSESLECFPSHPMEESNFHLQQMQTSFHAEEQKDPPQPSLLIAGFAVYSFTFFSGHYICISIGIYIERNQ